MGKLRSVNTHFWSDNYIIDLDPTEKLLFLYLLTNENTNMLGIYELHVRKIAFETGIDKDMILKIFERFAKDSKASYIDGYVCLINFTRHQSYNTNMKVSALNSYKELPDTVQKQAFIEPLLKALEPFPEGSEPIAEYELERERELEVEKEEEKKEEKNKTLLSELNSDDYDRSGSVADKIDWTTVRFHERVKERYGHHKNVKKATLENWRDPIRLMHESDGLDFEQIWSYIKFVFQDDFWKDTVKSTSGLRNNWEEIDASMNRRKSKNQNEQTGPIQLV